MTLRKLFPFILLSFSFLPSFGTYPTIHPDKIYFQSGTVFTQQDFVEKASWLIPQSDIIDGHYYRVLQFNEIPDQNRRDELKNSGLTILNYLPYNAFFVSIKVGTNLQQFTAYSIRTILRFELGQKGSRAIRENNIPDYAKTIAGKSDLIVQYFSDMDHETVIREFASLNIEVLKVIEVGSQMRIRILNDDIESLLKLPFVKYVEEMEAPSQPEDMRGRSLHRSNMINSDYASGLHYDGSGVSISLADDGEVGPHIDFEGRITQLISTGAGGSHGDMTSGIAVGAGNLNPLNQGMASGAHLYIHDVNDGVNPYDHIYNAPFFYTTYGAVITSTSYSQGCNDYNTISSTGDQIAHQNPYLNFVYSAGNRGQDDCGYGTNAAWGTITGGFKQGKNAIACGNLDAYGVLDVSSSRGPAEDGRVKPDICSNGKNQNSTLDNNRYQVGGGTSAACPGIAGVTAQLIQAYREMHPGTEASSALIKGCLLNSAEDIGNPGPDFTYGWGRVNAYRALTTLQDSRYILDSVSQGGTKLHAITVPSGVLKLKCMLYWLDLEGDPVAAIALVNDLDLTVTNPSSTVFQPWILDPTPVVSNLTTNAVRGADHLNNMEQVTIDNPAAGNYSVNINGTLIPTGVQSYFLIWEFQTDEMTLTYPNGGEGFVPGETEALRWDAAEGTTTFNLEYSANNGSSWSTITSNLAATARQFDWVVPSVISDRVLVRVSRGIYSDESNSNLAILRLPTALNIDFVCLGMMQISWTAALGSSGYEVSRLGPKYMDPVDTTSSTSIQIPISDTINTWFSVRSIGVNGGKGRRAVAIQKLPGLINCSFADDLNLSSIVNPQAGLLFPCQNLSAVPLTINVRNEGSNIAFNFDLSYSINGATPVIENYTDTILPGGNINYTFSAPVDLSVPGSYQINFGISYSADANSTNNNIVHQVEVNNAGAIPLTENFQSNVFPPTGWEVEASGPNYEWTEKAGIVGSDGNITKAAWFDNYSYNSVGSRDYLTTILADFTGVAYPLLSFDVAHANFSGKSDALAVEVSTDCGANFISTTYLKAGATLASVPSSNTDWEPTQATDWRTDSLALTSYSNMMVLIRFVNINDYGNNLYIDNINLANNFNSGIQNQKQPVILSLYPNPSSQIFTLDLNNLPAEKLSVTVVDLNGREIKKMEFTDTSQEFNTTINLAEFPKAVYLVRISDGKTVYNLRATTI